MTTITIDDKVEEISPEEFFESQAQIAVWLQNFSSELKGSLDSITARTTKKHLRSQIWPEFKPYLDELYDRIQKAYEISQFENFLRVILLGTDSTIDDFYFDIDGLLLLYKNLPRKTVPGKNFIISRFFERRKGILRTIQKDALSYAGQRFVYDLLGGTAIIGHKDVPQFNFESLYKSRDVKRLKSRISDNIEKLGFEDDVFIQLMNTDDFDELFKNFTLLYKQYFEPKNKESAREFMLFQQKHEHLKEHVVPIYPQKYTYRYSTFEMSSQRFVDSSILRDRGEYEEDFLSRVLVFHKPDLSDEFFEEAKRKAKESFDGEFYRKGKDFEQEPYKAIFYEKDGQYFCLVKPLEKKGVLVVHSGNKNAYKKADFKDTCRTFVDGFMKDRLEMQLNGERYPEIAEPELSPMSYLYMEGEIPGLHILEPLTAEHTESDRLGFLDDFMFLNEGKEALDLGMSEDVPEFLGKDFTKRPKPNEYQSMHLRFDNRVELMGETELQRWNNVYGEASHMVYDADDKGEITSIRRKIFDIKSKKIRVKQGGDLIKIKRQMNDVLTEFFNKITNRIRLLYVNSIRQMALEVDEDPNSWFDAIVTFNELRCQFPTSKSQIGDARDYINDMPLNYFINQEPNLFYTSDRGDHLHLTNALFMSGLISKGIYSAEEYTQENAKIIEYRYKNVFNLLGLLNAAESNLKANDVARNIYGVGAFKYAKQLRESFEDDELPANYDEKIHKIRVPALETLVKHLDPKVIKEEVRIEYGKESGEEFKKFRRQFGDLVGEDFIGDSYIGILENIRAYVNEVWGRKLNIRDFGASARGS